MNCAVKTFMFKNRFGICPTKDARMFHYSIKLYGFIIICLVLTACGGGQQTGVPENETETGITDINPDPTDQSDDAEPVNASVIHWSAPVLFENGDVVAPSDISGFKIYKGSTADSMTVIANISDSSQTNFDLRSFGTGTFYFAITVYDSNSNESTLSTVLYLTVS